MSETTAEYHHLKKEKNTVIITQNGEGINSKDYSAYSLELFENTTELETKIHRIKLIARATNAISPVISIFKEEDCSCVISVACDALQRLIVAIENSESVWDVRNHNSDL